MADRDDHPTTPDPQARGSAVPRLELARYEVGERIGKGGMGEVLLARDLEIGREVAIKRMLDPTASSRSIARFVREARIQARLDHPAIVPVHEVGVDSEGHPYFVMKRLSGKTLRACLPERSRTQLLRVFVDVCFAVEYAHARRVVHRDLKPENIVLGEYGEVYVLDWGVAKIIGDSQEGDGEPTRDELATRAGAVIGTPGYMAPEQARGETAVDERADVYALGRILFEILTGESGSRRPSEVVDGVPPELDALCERALERDRDARLASAGELARGVQRYLDGDRDLEQRRALANEHLAAARAALGEDGDEARARAMREAGRALALDPRCTEAASVISRLMLEPPRLAPPAVGHALAAESLAMLRRTALPVAFIMLSFLALSAVIFALTRVSLREILVYDGMCTVIAGCAVMASTATRSRPLITLCAAMALTGLVAVLARMFPPFLLAPAIASLAGAVAPFTLQLERRSAAIAITVAFLLATLTPFAAERFGWIASTFTLVDQGVILHTGALQGSESALLVIALLYTVFSISTSAAIGYVIKRSEGEVRAKLHLQAWHLRQLVAG